MDTNNNVPNNNYTNNSITINKQSRVTIKKPSSPPPSSDFISIANNNNSPLVPSNSGGKKEDGQTVHNPIFKPRTFLVEFLLSSDFEVVSALCDVALVYEEGTTLAEALIDVFEANGKTKKLIYWSIQKEINICHSISTLFRGSTESVKLMSVLYFRLGREYLRQMAGNLVKDATTGSTSGPEGGSGSGSGTGVKDNLKRALILANNFLNHIFSSIDMCPSFLRQVLFFVKKEVSKKFPDAGSMMVGTFFFSRFLIPAIVTPHQYGFVPEPPSPDAQRVLVLISKILQNLSNGIEFDDNKEEYTAELNKFLNEKAKPMHEFFEKLTGIGKDESFERLFFVSMETEQAALNQITIIMKEHQQRIHALLTKPETKMNFIHIVEADLFRVPQIESDSWMPWSGKKKEKSRLKALEEKVERLEKLEQVLEDDLKTRKQLEKKVNELLHFALEQRELNEKNKKLVSELQCKNNALEEEIRGLRLKKSEPVTVADTPDTKEDQNSKSE